jgi:SAM-dependent methyltransferase
MSPLRTALLAQILGSFIAAALIQIGYPKLFDQTLLAAGIQGVCAAFVAHKLEAPRWWLAIHLAFMPLVAVAYGLGIDPLWYLAVFVVLILVFWRTDKSRVPLYLSNSITADAVLRLLPATPCHVLDLGCGDGRLLRRLARARPDCEFLGIEHAPLPWLWAWLGALGVSNCHIRRGDFWRQSLALFDVVYAFLSPVPMPRLWSKACAEMRPGTLLVSNSFTVPDVATEATVDVDDRRHTRLHCYRPACIGNLSMSAAATPE